MGEKLEDWKKFGNFEKKVRNLKNILKFEFFFEIWKKNLEIV